MSGQASSWGNDPSDVQSYLVKARCMNRDLILVTENKWKSFITQGLGNQALCDFVWLVSSRTYPNLIN